ncbi:hypothetical protein ACH4D3_00870 [Streptomyces sp. NPDC018026]|uniref:hypothetical protein n=1 Tax=Streptomyces sp. NPDC018026 TaxID=3365031 RepID=UPI0037AC73D3
MSSLQSALLACATVVALVLAFAAFRVAARSSPPPGQSWAAAGAAVVAFAVDVASVMSALGLPETTPGAVRIAWTGFGVLCSAAVAVFAYTVNTPAPAPAGGSTVPVASTPVQVFAAGGAFTGALTVMGVLAILLG